MSDTSDERQVPRDLAAGGLFLIIGIATLVLIPGQIPNADRGLEVGPRYLPQMMGIIITALSGGLILKTLFQVRRNTAERASASSLVPTLQGLGIIGLILLWLGGLQVAPYLVVSPVVVVAGLLMFGVKTPRHHLIGIGFVVAVWAMFRFVLQVRLP